MVFAPYGSPQNNINENWNPFKKIMFKYFSINILTVDTQRKFLCNLEWILIEIEKRITIIVVF